MLHKLRDTATLTWADRRSGEFHVRGGVCWPEQVGDRYEGALVIVGQNINEPERRAIVFECETFYGVYPMLEKANVIHPGAAPMFDAGWSAYKCRTYYYRQLIGIHHEHLLEVLRCGAIQPKPRFVEAPFENADHARAILSDWFGQGRVRAPAGGLALSAWASMAHAPAGSPLPPAVRALACALSGLGRHPWRREHVGHSDVPAPGFVDE